MAVIAWTALVGAGIHVMRFNPQGMWDDKEEYSFIGALDAEHFSQVILEANDYFLTARLGLTRLVISWLKTECGF